MKLCYYAALSAYNSINQSRRSGLVFVMAPAPEEPFSTLEEVTAFFHRDPKKLEFLAKSGKSLIYDNHVLLKLRYPEQFNPIPIDIHTFVAFSDYLDYHENEYGQPCLQLTPRLQGDLHYSRIKRQFTCWMHGEYGGPFVEESAKILRDFETMIQLHLPYIRSENIVSIHPVEEAFAEFSHF